MNVELIVKSTIEWILYQLAEDLDPVPPVLDMDDPMNTDEVKAKAGTALVWGWGDMQDEEPGGSLRTTTFHVGVKVSNDPSNYILLGLASQVSDKFSPQQSFALKDYSGTEAGSQVGTLFITERSLNPQYSDRVSGVRYYKVVAKIALWPS